MSTTEQHTLNSLARSSSAYLRTAMHQPVQWHEFGEEALALAQRENKPILLDIGAVWCHWCHVMDRESYENPEIAEIINRHFVAVKVDRDERPDVDSRYQAAVSAISGQGGWPLTAFLTPDGRPFFGGTYFPPHDHYGRPGFRRVLLSLAQAYHEKHDEVLESAEHVMSAISSAESFAGRSGDINPSLLDKFTAAAAKLFDPQNGGFGTQPKFPHPSLLDLLLDRVATADDAEARRIVSTTLTRMARGGVYDQLGGGFHRYSVDERWVVPHFEKMSYDNSELLKNYVHAAQNLTGEDPGRSFYSGIARDIIRWMDEWLSDREHGGFYASQDADINLDDDGDYFTWSLAEARQVLAGAELEAAVAHYDIGEVGEMHHDPTRNVLFLRAGVEQVATRISQSREETERTLQSAKAKMLEARLRRPTPYVDKTVYVSWNAMCISAYLEAAKALELPEAGRFALRSLDRLLSQAWKPDSGLAHVIAYSDPAAEYRRVPGMLDDYALAALACLDAYEATSDLSYFKFAEQISRSMIDRFFDSTGGGFHDREDTGSAIGALAAKRKPLQDSPTPAGNPVAALALLRLHAYTNTNEYRDKAEATLEAFAGIVEHFGIYAGTYGLAQSLYSGPHLQVVVCGSDALADSLYAHAVSPFSVRKSVLRLREGHAVPANLPPALRDTIPQLPAVQQGRSVAVVCANFACQPPLDDPERLQEAIALALAGK